jgi:hypothetical protein
MSPPMLHALAFVVCREPSLLRGASTWPDLVEAQRQGLRSGTQLRMFRLPTTTAETANDLMTSGELSAAGDPPTLGTGPAQVICDALVPLIDPRSLWLGIYQLSGWEQDVSNRASGPRMQVESITCLDCYPLQDAANETCWFYPTDNGRYLAWENRKRLQTLPGHLPDRSPQPNPLPYSHGDVHVLWSLMADDLALTCVGLTYRRLRIEWPLLAEVPEELATWTEFVVDSMAETSYQELNSTTMFAVNEPGA